jgi:hypothetical protein
MAYMGRLIQILFLDAVLIGLFGGSLTLFYALLRHIHPGRWLLSVCFLLGLAGWLGHAYGDYRFTQRSVSRSGGDAVIETVGVERLEPLLDEGKLKEMRARALVIFEDKLEEKTGRRGLRGFIQYRWQNGMVALGLGPNKSRIPLPESAVVLGEILGIFLSMGMAILVLRRLAWVPTCPSCGRYLEKPSEGEQSNTEDGTAPLRCPGCGDSGELSRDPEIS